MLLVNPIDGVGEKSSLQRCVRSFPYARCLYGSIYLFRSYFCKSRILQPVRYDVKGHPSQELRHLRNYYFHSSRYLTALLKPQTSLIIAPRFALRRSLPHPNPVVAVRLVVAMRPMLSRALMIISLLFIGHLMSSSATANTISESAKPKPHDASSKPTLGCTKRSISVSGSMIVAAMFVLAHVGAAQ